MSAILAWGAVEKHGSPDQKGRSLYAHTAEVYSATRKPIDGAEGSYAGLGIVALDPRNGRVPWWITTALVIQVASAG